MVTKFDTVRAVTAGAGACACPVETSAQSRAALSRDCLVGNRIALSLGFKTSSPGLVVRWSVGYPLDLSMGPVRVGRRNRPEYADRASLSERAQYCLVAP